MVRGLYKTTFNGARIIRNNLQVRLHSEAHAREGLWVEASLAHRGGALLFPSSADALRRYHALDAGWLGEAHWNLTDTLRSAPLYKTPFNGAPLYKTPFNGAPLYKTQFRCSARNWPS